MAENIIGIATKTGYAHKRRLRGILLAAQRELLNAGTDHA